ncbi:hypothetical protein MKY41_11345 [Sporosarcina sp. FSL W7-1349]|uniref:hypothetical protein n=1 Tax=Sporosarcina sp. FSL W7-1349 TaxID=2921561 RepID=UPI0030F993D2
MGVNEVLEAVSSGEYLLELNVFNDAPADTVIVGAVSEKSNPGGFGRREFAFRGEQQNELLVGLAEIINTK